MLDPATAAFIQSGVSISIAACDARRLGSMSRGYGCKFVPGDGSVTVFVCRSQAADLLANVTANGRVANVFSLPSSNRTVQLKGQDARLVPLDDGDLALVARHVADFAAELLSVGLSERFGQALFHYAADDLLGIRYTPLQSFSQTPGPNAGAALDGK